MWVLGAAAGRNYNTIQYIMEEPPLGTSITLQGLQAGRGGAGLDSVGVAAGGAAVAARRCHNYN
jgi:hypothetical protein